MKGWIYISISIALFWTVDFIYGERTLSQFIAFPFLAYGVLHIEFPKGNRLPNFLVVASCIFAYGLAFFDYLTPVVPMRAIYVSDLAGDDLGGVSRTFRVRLNRFVKRLNDSLEVRRLAQSITDINTARSAVKESSIPFLVWGNQETLTVVVPDEGILQLKELGVVDHVPVGLRKILDKMTLLNGIDSFSVSYEPNIATADFLSLVFNGLYSDDEAARVSNLLVAGSIRSPWRSYGHKAYPYFVLATDNLIRSATPIGINWGRIWCALDMYQKAAGFLPSAGENPKLYAGIFNNHGVALVLKYARTEDKTYLKKAKKEFQFAKLALIRKAHINTTDLIRYIKKNKQLTKRLMNNNNPKKKYRKYMKRKRKKERKEK